MSPLVTLHHHDVSRRLRLPDGSWHCCVTSPPYWGLRDYTLPPSIWGGKVRCEHEWSEFRQPAADGTWTPEGNSALRAGHQGVVSATMKPKTSAFCTKCKAWRGCLGLEPTPELYIKHLVMVMRQVRRVLRDDGVLWLNLGDCYATGAGSARSPGGGSFGKANEVVDSGSFPKSQPNRMRLKGLKPKDLVMMPSRVALALQADGWWLRHALPWIKPNPMPESTTDRPGRGVEWFFMFTKKARYFYDRVAVLQDARSDGGASVGPQTKLKVPGGWKLGPGNHGTIHDEGRTSAVYVHSRRFADPSERNVAQGKRNWRDGDLFFSALRAWPGNLGLVSDAQGDPLAIVSPTQSFSGAHFATFPEFIVQPLIAASTSEKGCCRACGRCWERIVARKRVRTRPGTDTKVTGNALVDGYRDPGRHVTEALTVGWRPRCKCLKPEIVPCVVGDPFGGSGTVGLVAASMGRRAELFDANPQYLEMARERLGLFADLEEPAVP